MRRLGTFLSIIFILSFAIISCSDMIPWLEAGFIHDGDIIQATDSTGQKVEIKVKNKEVIIDEGNPSEIKLVYDEGDDEHKPDRGTYVVYLDDNNGTRYVMHVDSDGKTTIEQRFTYEKDGKTITEMVPVTTERVELTTEPFGKGKLNVDGKNITTKTQTTYLKGSKATLLAQEDDAGEYGFSQWVEDQKNINGLHNSKDASKIIVVSADAEVTGRFAFKAHGPLAKEETIELDFSDSGGTKEQTTINYDDDEGMIKGITIGDEDDAINLVIKEDSSPKEEDDGSWKYEFTLEDFEAGDATYVIIVDENGNKTFGQKIEGEDDIIAVKAKIVTLRANAKEVGEVDGGMAGVSGKTSTTGKVQIDSSPFAFDSETKYLSNSQVLLGYNTKDNQVTFLNWEIEKDNTESLLKETIENVDNGNSAVRFRDVTVSSNRRY
ncbi:MAG: hypothetical protein ACOX0W_02215 [Sphaerochaetaceae bacterium]